MLYQISTGQTFELDSANDSFLPKIYGDVVVWLKSTANGNLALMYRISWGTPVVPVVLAGPVPNPKDIEVGDRFVVWAQIVNGQYDVAAYDIQNGGSPVSVASNSTLHERVSIDRWSLGGVSSFSRLPPLRLLLFMHEILTPARLASSLTTGRPTHRRTSMAT